VLKEFDGSRPLAEAAIFICGEQFCVERSSAEWERKGKWKTGRGWAGRSKECKERGEWPKRMPYAQGSVDFVRSW
jgi:hypothetical protein